MKRRIAGLVVTGSVAGALLLAPAVSLYGQSANWRVRAVELERTDPGAARAVLLRASQATPQEPEAQLRYAEFLDRYGDQAARTEYRKITGTLRPLTVSRRLVLLDLIAGDRAAADTDLALYRSAGGTDWKDLKWAAAPQEAQEYATIPGPLRSFGRMAAISGDINPNDVLNALARNVVTNGYQASHSNDALEQTEYLKLVNRYLSQARELEKLAAADGFIKIDTCDSAQTGDLLRILGFRMRGGCGSEVVLETVNATRAFLSTDSGFPIAQLEQALRTNQPFAYDFHPTRIPVLYGTEYWLGQKDTAGSFMDNFLGDPSLCRFYLGISKLDRETADQLRKGIPAARLRTYSHVLDFFGGMFEVRNGHAVVPGGQRSAAAWSELVGANPQNGPQFFEKLLAKDDGWLASQYDALARIHGPVQDYLTDPARMKRFYNAVRGKVTSPGPARPVFRSNADMMLLTTRLRLDPNGQPHIPGSLEVWKNLFINHPKGKYDGKLSKTAQAWKDPDDVLEALFGMSRKAVENEPLKIFMALSDLDRGRPEPLKAETVDRLARAYKEYGAQYSLFSDSTAVSDRTVMQFMDTAEAVEHTRDTMIRQNSAGMMQALTGLWQILCRQSMISPAKADAALSGIVAPFAEASNERALFDAGRSGVKLLLAATSTQLSAQPQEQMIGLLAGAAAPADTDARDKLVTDMMHVLEAQRILSLDVIFQLADNLESVSKGEKLNPALAARLAARVGDIQLPRASLSGAEKNALAFGYWTERHVEMERKLNMRALIDKAQNNPEKLKDLRGALTPFLRDTLVAYNYVHYAPPGAQILYTNPLFVRGHDFIGMQGASHTWKTTEMLGTGWPSNGGGRLTGSLANLPYALAEAEQNFLVPTQTQALIWGDLVPQMILSAKIPRWWNVTSGQVHWVGAQMRFGETLLAESALDPVLRQKAMAALDLQAPPARRMLVERALEQGNVQEAIERVTPSELFGMASEISLTAPNAELSRLQKENGQSVNDAAISAAFGTPKPTLANSYRPELLRLRTFPTLMGYSSRIMAESWESNTLYWASLADQLHIAPSQLNVLIPEWTQKVVERIFASHLEDWPALLKSLRLVGEDVRAEALRGAAEAKPAGIE